MKIKQVLLILISLILLSCNNKKDHENLLIEDNIDNLYQKEYKLKDPILKKNVSKWFNIDTLKIDDERCLFYRDTSNNSFILNEKLDTIFKTDYLIEYEFVDFDNNDSKDLIFVKYLGNTPGVNELALFNEELKKFVIVEDLFNFPAPLRLKGTNLYYSYHKSGCADSNWDSDLFYITANYKAVRIGNIHGEGCPLDSEKAGIYVNKVIKDSLIQIKYFSREPGYYDDKWEFIEEYWNSNYRVFLK